MSLFQILFCFVYNTVNFVSLFWILLFTRRSTLQICFRFCFVHKIVNLCKFVSDFVLFCLLDGQLCEFISDFVVVHRTVSFVSVFQVWFSLQDCELCMFLLDFVLLYSQDGKLCTFVSDFVSFTRRSPL